VNDSYIWWLLILGIGIGVALVWLVLVRMPREEGDVDAIERDAEASWISRTIESDGGIAPEPLVAEILELHQAYLNAGGATPVLPDTPFEDIEEQEEAAAGSR
jgi:hypothetical protein